MANYDVVIVDAVDHAYRYWVPLRTSVTATNKSNSIEAGFVVGLAAMIEHFPHCPIVLAWDGRLIDDLDPLSVEEPSKKRAGPHDPPEDWPQRIEALRTALNGPFHMLFDPTANANLVLEFGAVDRLFAQVNTLPGLTKAQRQRLESNEHTVKFFLHMNNLLGDTQQPHSHGPTGDGGPLLSLLQTLELGVFADVFMQVGQQATATSLPVLPT